MNIKFHFNAYIIIDYEERLLIIDHKERKRERSWYFCILGKVCVEENLNSLVVKHSSIFPYCVFGNIYEYLETDLLKKTKTKKPTDLLF